MAVGDKQKLITEILEKVLNQIAETKITFNWFINSHKKSNFGEHYDYIQKIFLLLNGDLFENQNKKQVYLKCDAYFGGKYNFIFEFDEIQNFSSARFITLNNYPKNLKLNYSLINWKDYCLQNRIKADKYRFNKTTKDFNFLGGRINQRAYLDCFRDLLPSQNGLNPTLRISEFEVKGIYQNNFKNQQRVKKIIENQLKFL